MRVYICGQAVTVPARWYFCAPGAQFFPSPHGAEASPWLQNFQLNRAWGEVTPWPQDPTQDFWRGLDRGKNPGYAGQCYVGDYQWFVDGQLPCDILSRDPTPFPDCCSPAPATSEGGGIVIGGTALASGDAAQTARTVGGLVLGGTATATGEGSLATTAGGLVLGGRAQPGVSVGSVGGLVLGGTAYASGSGSGGQTCETAGVLQLGFPSLPMPFVAGTYYWKIFLTAGQEVHWTVPGGPDSNEQWTFYLNADCHRLKPGSSGGGGCWTFTPSVSQYYLFDVQIQYGTSGTWTWEVDAGGCP